MRPERPRKAANWQLLDDIERLHADHHERYGALRIRAALRAQGRTVSPGAGRTPHAPSWSSRPASSGLSGLHHRQQSRPADRPNLLDRNFAPTALNRFWLTDIIYVPTDEGWLYVAVVLDLFSRKSVGWAMRDYLRTELPLAALTMALQRQQPAPNLLHHSDPGSQYASTEYRKTLKSRGITPSMSYKRNCWAMRRWKAFSEA